MPSDSFCGGILPDKVGFRYGMDRDIWQDLAQLNENLPESCLNPVFVDIPKVGYVSLGNQLWSLIVMTSFQQLDHRSC